MSAKVGGNAQALQGMSIQSSCYGNPVPICYGTNRVSGNLIDYDDFIATANKSGGGGFLGIGGSSVTTGYTYGAMVVQGLCEGPIVTTGRVWEGQVVTTAALSSPAGAVPLTILTGARPQTAWSYLTSNHPAKALPYSGTALACCWDLILPGGSMGNWSFEVAGLLATETDTSGQISIGTGDGTNKTFYLLDINGIAVSSMAAYPGYQVYVNGVLKTLTTDYTLGATSTQFFITFVTAPANGAAITWMGAPVVALDAKPASIVSDFLTNANYGAGVAAGWIADMVTGAASYATYCTAMGFKIAPVLKDAKAAAEHLREILDATNSELITTPNSSGVMQIQVIPYGDVAVGGFTPVTTIQAAFTDADFLGVLDANGNATGNDPITITRQSPGDTFNTVPVTFSDRMNAYNQNTIFVAEPTDAALNGTRKAAAKALPSIVLRQHATVLSTILGQAQVFRKTTFKFQVGWDAFLLEPLDFISIQSAIMGLPTTRVRIVAVTIPEEGSEDAGLTIEAEGWPSLGVAHASGPVSSTSAGSGTTINTNIDPGPTTAPTIIDVAPLYSVSGGPEILIGADGGANWGGANVWISTDNVNFTQAGTITAAARYGTLTTSMAASGGASVDLTLTTGAMASTTSTLALANQSLMWVAGASGGSGGELVDYSTATLTAAYKYTLTLPVRGAYGTTAATHSNGAAVMLCDGAPFRLTIPLAWLGSPVYIKLQAFNTWGAGTQTLSSLTATAYTPTSQGTYANPTGGTITTVWNLNSDDVLARAQKPNEINLYNQCLQTQGSSVTVGSLDYQAAQLGVSTTAYDTAIAALTTWLGALVPSWTDLTQDTPLGTGGGAYLRGLWSTIAQQQQKVMAAIQVAALASAASASLVLANAAGLQNPTVAAWSSTTKPTLPNGTYPPGSCWVTTDGLEYQVSPNGSAWNKVTVAATALFGQVLASQITVANLINLIPNPNSNQVAPPGGWPAGAWETAALSSGTASPYGGTGIRLLNGTGAFQIVDLTGPIPCKPGDAYNFYAGQAADWGVADHGQLLISYYDTLAHAAAKSSVAYAVSGNTGGPWAPLSVTLAAPATAQYVVFSLCNTQAIGNQAGFTGLLARQCSDASVILDGTLTTLFARYGNWLASTNNNHALVSSTVPPVGVYMSGQQFTTVYTENTYTAGTFIIGQQYQVVSAGTTTWASCGGSWIGTVGAVGSIFTATAAGSGTGTANHCATDCILELGGSVNLQGYQLGQLGVAKLWLNSASNGVAFFASCATAGSDVAWSWTAPKMGAAGTPYWVEVTIQEAGQGGYRGTAGGAGSTLTFRLLVQDGTVLSGRVAGGGLAGSTTAPALPLDTTIAISGTNISGLSGTIATLHHTVIGDSSLISGTYFYMVVVGVNSPGTSSSSTNSSACSGGGGGQGNGAIGGGMSGWAGGAQFGYGPGGGASAFGPGGAGATTATGNGSAPPAFAYGAGGGGSQSSTGGTGGQGQPGAIFIRFL